MNNQLLIPQSELEKQAQASRNISKIFNPNNKYVRIEKEIIRRINQ
jgi:hypothetical protein